MIEQIKAKIKRCFLKESIKKLGNNYSIHSSVSFKNPKYMSIGDDFYVAEGSIIEAWDSYNDIYYTPEIIIGNNVRIGRHCHIGAINKIVIGDNCLLGSYILLMDHAHGKSILSQTDIPPAQRDLYSKGSIILGRNVWIGEKATILAGVEIGDCSIIGANTVVTKDVPPYCVFAGNPGKVVKFINE